MLIVNADDFGRQRIATDRILACHAHGRLTSASAMVFMEDSERAAPLALAAGLDVGLHINLSELFTAAATPPPLREAQGQICRFLKASKYALLLYHPGLRRQFREVFQAQHAEFVRLYGRQPSHFDGHQHMHLATNMLLQRILPAGTKVRRSFSFRPGEKGMVNRAYRRLVDRRLARRHRLTDYFFSVAQHFPPDRFEYVLDRAADASVELMTHPENQADYDFLMGDWYRQAVARVRLASYELL